MGSVRLYGATSGYLELQAPDVSPDAALVLPSTGFGKVLQVVRATDTVRRTSTSGTYADTGLSVTITPSQSSSTVLLIWTGEIATTGSSAYGEIQITDSSNNAISAAERASHGPTTELSFAIFGYATPATTSATTYKTRYKRISGTSIIVYNDIHTGQLFAIEVAA